MFSIYWSKLQRDVAPVSPPYLVAASIGSRASDSLTAAVSRDSTVTRQQRGRSNACNVEDVKGAAFASIPL